MTEPRDLKEGDMVEFLRNVTAYMGRDEIYYLAKGERRRFIRYYTSSSPITNRCGAKEGCAEVEYNSQLSFLVALSAIVRVDPSQPQSEG